MSTEWIGSIGIGAVWGWLAGQTTIQKNNSFAKTSNIAAGTATIIILIYLLSDILSIGVFALAVTCAFTLHISWIYRIRQKVKSNLQSKERN